MNNHLQIGAYNAPICKRNNGRSRMGKIILQPQFKPPAPCDVLIIFECLRDHRVVLEIQRHLDVAIYLHDP
jgi:hypothetical protein